MARVPMVTRTIQTTKVKVLCLDLKSEQPFNTDVTLPRVYKDDSHILKVVKQLIDTDDIKAVHIANVEVEEVLYGMTEAKFIETAEVLPLRNKKTILASENNDNN